MEWHKVEDYPVGSDEYVLVSLKWNGKRLPADCFVAKKQGTIGWLIMKNIILILQTAGVILICRRIEYDLLRIS